MFLNDNLTEDFYKPVTIESLNFMETYWAGSICSAQQYINFQYFLFLSVIFIWTALLSLSSRYQVYKSKLARFWSKMGRKAILHFLKPDLIKANFNHESISTKGKLEIQENNVG